MIRQLTALNTQTGSKEAEQLPTATSTPRKKAARKAWNQSAGDPVLLPGISGGVAGAAPFNHSLDAPLGRWSHFFGQKNEHIPFAV